LFAMMVAMLFSLVLSVLALAVLPLTILESMQE